MIKAQDFAKKAVDILAERGNDNGYDKGEERSAAKIAQVFNIVSGRDLTEAEAWLFMICLKLVREGGKHQVDNCLDLANYAFLRAETLQVHDEKQITLECNQPAPVDLKYGFRAWGPNVTYMVEPAPVDLKYGFRAWGPNVTYMVEPAVRVDVVLRDGTLVQNRYAELLDWRNHGDGDNIIAWRRAFYMHADVREWAGRYASRVRSSDIQKFVTDEIKKQKKPGGLLSGN